MSGPAELLFKRPSKDTLKVILSGSWKLGEALPSAEDVRHEAESTGQIRRIAFDTVKLERWDSGLLAFLKNLSKLCSACNMTIDGRGLPENVHRSGGLGLRTMFHRCRLFGGSLDIYTHDDGGTRVRCCFPLHAETGAG